MKLYVINMFISGMKGWKGKKVRGYLIKINN